MGEYVITGWFDVPKLCSKKYCFGLCVVVLGRVLSAYWLCTCPTLSTLVSLNTMGAGALGQLLLGASGFPNLAPHFSELPPGILPGISPVGRRFPFVVGRLRLA